MTTIRTATVAALITVAITTLLFWAVPQRTVRAQTQSSGFNPHPVCTGNSPESGSQSVNPAFACMPELDGTGHNEKIVEFQVAAKVAMAHGGGHREGT
jgi:hypothetical protein